MTVCTPETHHPLQQPNILAELCLPPPLIECHAQQCLSKQTESGVMYI
jgi:hypothetical protein